MKDLNDYISIYTDTIPKGVCSEICQELDSNNHWQRHTYHIPSENTFYDNSEKDLFVSNVRTKHQPLIENITNNIINDYISDLPLSSKFSATRYTPMRYNKYPKGTHMDTHIDHIHTLFDNNNSGIPILTLLFTFNDEFTGGEFTLADNVYPLGAGDVIVFPSNFMFPHKVDEIISGVRYSGVTWVV